MINEYLDVAIEFERKKLIAQVIKCIEDSIVTDEDGDYISQPERLLEKIECLVD